MFSKSRLIVALGLVLALAVSGIAFAVGTDNNAFVDGKVTPSKLDKKKYKKVNLFLGVRNETNVTPESTDNPGKEYISIGKNVKINLNAAEECPVTLSNGTPTETAKQQCPKDSFLGSGEAEVKAPGNSTTAEPVVSVFYGPGKGNLQLHTYSENLGAASPVVPAKIVKSKDGAKYGSALDVPVAPETGALMITKFNATIEKSTGFATARCKAKKIPFLRTVTYKDGTSETASLTQKCKRKKGGK